jgi:hypothetical protein
VMVVVTIIKVLKTRRLGQVKWVLVVSVAQRTAPSGARRWFTAAR